MQAFESDISADLRELELDHLPGTEQLQRRIRRLLFHYHPDRNHQRRDWAHERTLRILESGQRLIRTARTNGARATVRSRPAAQPARRPAPRPGTFQLLCRQKEGYAIPVSGIVRVVVLKEADLRERGEQFYVVQPARTYRVVGLNGPLPRATTELNGQRAVLFQAGAAAERLAIYVPRGFVFERIAEFDERELLAAGNLDDHCGAGRLIVSGEQLFAIPELLFAGQDARDGRR